MAIARWRSMARSQSSMPVVLPASMTSATRTLIRACCRSLRALATPRADAAETLGMRQQQVERFQHQRVVDDEYGLHVVCP